MKNIKDIQQFLCTCSPEMLKKIHNLCESIMAIDQIRETKEEQIPTEREVREHDYTRAKMLFDSKGYQNAALWQRVKVLIEQNENTGELVEECYQYRKWQREILDILNLPISFSPEGNHQAIIKVITCHMIK
jgi:hypothetical protein